VWWCRNVVTAVFWAPCSSVMVCHASWTFPRHLSPVSSASIPSVPAVIFQSGWRTRQHQQPSLMEALMVGLRRSYLEFIFLAQTFTGHTEFQQNESKAAVALSANEHWSGSKPISCWYHDHHHYVACRMDVAVSTSDLHACRFCARW